MKELSYIYAYCIVLVNFFISMRYDIYIEASI